MNSSGAGGDVATGCERIVVQKQSRKNLAKATPRAEFLSSVSTVALALAAMLAVGTGAPRAAEIQQNNGFNGTNATSESATPTADTSGGTVNFNDTTPQSVSDAGFQTI
ncbi:hypothetical protein ABLE91_01120 [Aquabacter sp. CN5-332]|uniref:hypothetical protein n=1 Tax=Aquabacter sp. CN5-332 TaxID=3156608 RepID=UPI0032B38B18